MVTILILIMHTIRRAHAGEVRNKGAHPPIAVLQHSGRASTTAIARGVALSLKATRCRLSAGWACNSPQKKVQPAAIVTVFHVPYNVLSLCCPRFVFCFCISLARVSLRRVPAPSASADQQAFMLHECVPRAAHPHDGRRRRTQGVSRCIHE